MKFATLLLMLLLLAAPARACFGPKLYLGTGAGAQEEVLFHLVSLYLKEKTGIETVRVDLRGEDPRAALAAQRVDLAFLPREGGGERLLSVPGLPTLVAGRRPLEELQFTTVAPALRKLGGVLTAADVQALTAEVGGGASPAAAVRRLLTARGWI